MLEIDGLEPHGTSLQSHILVSEGAGAVKFENETVETAVANQLGDPRWIKSSFSYYREGNKKNLNPTTYLATDSSTLHDKYKGPFLASLRPSLLLPYHSEQLGKAPLPRVLWICHKEKHGKLSIQTKTEINTILSIKQPKRYVKHQNKNLKPLYQALAPQTVILYVFHFGCPHVLDFLQLILPDHDTLPLLIRGHRVNPFVLPALDPFDSLNDLPVCHFIFLAHLAFPRDTRSFINQLHAAGFSRSVFFGTMGTESTPLVVSAGENLLIIETHGIFGGRKEDEEIGV